MKGLRDIAQYKYCG